MDNDFVVVYVARDLLRAHMLVAALKEASVEAHVTNEHLQSLIGMVPPGLSSRPQVLVRESDVETAMTVLRHIEGEKQTADSAEPED